MICKNCRISADWEKRGRDANFGHVYCDNKVWRGEEGVVHTREVELNGCFCQHHPVGTGQIKKESNA